MMQSVANFKTTADIRSVDDSSLLSYIRLYTIAFASMVVIDIMFRQFSIGTTNLVDTAALAAFVCTVPKNKPRFRSLRRFAIALGLAALLAFVAASMYNPFVQNVSASSWVAKSVFYTIAFGCIESLSFWWTCVVTPGRGNDPKTADNHPFLKEFGDSE